MDTPISVLQEFCARFGLVPEYNLLSVEGLVHAPIFVYRVQIGDLVTTASGQSKKKSKHSAALSALEIFAEKNEIPGYDALLASGTNFVGDTQQIPDETSAKPGSENNPVGKLQEICMKRRWRPPSYETVNEIGLPHERVFTMTCIIENIEMEVQGIGRSKKIAKRNAALEILKKLEEMKIYQPSLENQEKSSRHYHDTSFLYDTTSTSNARAKERIEEFYKNIGEELNNELDEVIPKIDLKTEQLQLYDYCEILKTVSEYIECKIKYIELPLQSKKFNLQCLVHLIPRDSFQSELPIITATGSQLTLESAKQEAAKKALFLFGKIRFYG